MSRGDDLRCPATVAASPRTFATGCADPRVSAALRAASTRWRIQDCPNYRTCRIADVARAHTHALPDIFHRSSMDAMIADSNCIFPLSGKPNAEYELVKRMVDSTRKVRRTPSYVSVEMTPGLGSRGDHMPPVLEVIGGPGVSIHLPYGRAVFCCRGVTARNRSDLGGAGPACRLAYDTDVQIIVIRDPGAALCPGCAGLRRRGRGDRRGCSLSLMACRGCF
jgi:hypothetical protein